MSAILSLAFVAAVLRISVPYALAALGGAFAERSGVVNIALEGMLLVGAFAATVGAYASGSAALGVLAGAAGGASLAALYALLVLSFRADQIVCGIGINLFADGVTRFLLKATFDSSSNSPRVAAWGSAPEGLGALGATLSHPLVIGTLALAGLAHLLWHKTPLGLRLRAVGDHPEAAASLGVRVWVVRAICVVLSGALAGLGGAWLAWDQHQFVAGMSNGRGYIALAAMIFGRWRPVPAVLACLMFGAAVALQIALHAAGAHVPGWAVQMLPYLLTMIALAGAIGQVDAPRALGRSPN